MDGWQNQHVRRAQEQLSDDAMDPDGLKDQNLTEPVSLKQKLSPNTTTEPELSHWF